MQPRFYNDDTCFGCCGYRPPCPWWCWPLCWLRRLLALLGI